MNYTPLRTNREFGEVIHLLARPQHSQGFVKILVMLH